MRKVTIFFLLILELCSNGENENMQPDAKQIEEENGNETRKKIHVISHHTRGFCKSVQLISQFSMFSSSKDVIKILITF